MAKTQKNGISKKDIIKNVLDRYPEKAQKLAQTMMDAGLNCVGCHASTSESLEEGMLSHGMTPKAIDSLVKEMNKTVGEKVKVKAVAVSEEAAKKIKGLLTDEKKSGWGLKIDVRSGGCGGYQYELSFQKESLDGEIFTESRGIKIFYGMDDAELLSGSEVEYADGPHGEGFRISNPNVKSGCECGH